jgi:2-oxo-4-hydroxy-4-carboxy--5-ureidoimidazoline (OHCU) decarboxylase
VLPAGNLAVYGFQHVLAFYAGAVIVPILLAGVIGLSDRELIHLINADLFTCGIASIIQAKGFWKVGVRLPLLQGVTFTAVSPMIAIGLVAGGGTDGLLVIYGSVIVAGLVSFLVAPYFSKLIRFFPPVVTGSVILIIGLALLPVAALDAVGGGSDPQPGNLRNLAYALGTLLVIVAIQRIFRDFMATVAVLVGLVLGTLVAWGLGDAHFDAVGESSWFGVTTPFYFGWPQFGFAATFGRLFQGPGEVVGRAYDRRPFADTGALRSAFQEALFSAPRSGQRALMAHYPDLGGDRVADGEEGEDSVRDQSAAGLTRLTETDREEFAAAYRKRFGIPLIVCVRDSSREHATALIEIAKVAGHRFADLVADADPIASARARAFRGER